MCEPIPSHSAFRVGCALRAMLSLRLVGSAAASGIVGGHFDGMRSVAQPEAWDHHEAENRRSVEVPGQHAGCHEEGLASSIVAGPV